MDDKDTKENPSPDFNKLDLAELQSLSFGTQWTQDKSSPVDKSGQGDRPRRDNRRDGPSAPRRDRRGFSKPAGGGQQPGGERRDQGPGRPANPGGRPARRDFRGAPRSDDRFEGRGAPQDRGPYESPYFDVGFYPEDTSFAALAKTIRASYRTIELFEIARTVVAKNDRFIAVLTRKSAKPDAEKKPLYISVPDGVPFESEDAVIRHVMELHLGMFFETADVEIDPPKGNFQVINKCGVTGELLGPPNYHLYNQIAQQHFETKVSRVSPEAFRARIESVRDPEAVAQWLEKMKKVTRYTWRNLEAPAPAKPAAAETSEPIKVAPDAAEETPVDEPTVSDDATEVVPNVSDEALAEAKVETPPPVETETPATAEAPVTDETPVEVEAPATITFDSVDDARMHLLSQARDRVYKTVETARFHGHLIEKLPRSEIRAAVEGALERQRRFPLDTANGLRGRLRREHFTIFKKGSKGVSYVCAVKRKFRVPGQTFSDSIGALISFIEINPMIKVSELTAKFLDIHQPAPVATDGDAAAPVTPELSPEQKEKFTRMQGDLRWLVMEGYVTEFIDGRLFAAPPIPESKKREKDNAENDPESYPDAPAEAVVTPATPVAVKPPEETAATVVETPAVETPAVETPTKPIPEGKPAESSPVQETDSPTDPTTEEGKAEGETPPRVN